MTACAKCGHNPHAIVTASWSFHVDRDPPSLNARLFNASSKRWAYGKERNEWQWLIKAARINGRIPQATCRRRITLTRHYAGRQQQRDRDNLAGGMKAVVDALVLEKLLVDDSEKYAEMHYQQVRSTPTGLVFLIEELAC